MQPQLYIPPADSATSIRIRRLTEADTYEQELETLLTTLDLIREQEAAIERGNWLFAPKYTPVVENGGAA